jgi:hypothetical protein
LQTVNLVNCPFFLRLLVNEYAPWFLRVLDLIHLWLLVHLGHS